MKYRSEMMAGSVAIGLRHGAAARISQAMGGGLLDYAAWATSISRGLLEAAASLRYQEKQVQRAIEVVES